MHCRQRMRRIGEVEMYSRRDLMARMAAMSLGRYAVQTHDQRSLRSQLKEMTSGYRSLMPAYRSCRTRSPSFRFFQFSSMLVIVCSMTREA